jgi:hypothetical protein
MAVLLIKLLLALVFGHASPDAERLLTPQRKIATLDTNPTLRAY